MAEGVFVCLQVSWEGDDSDSTDDLSPWELYSADVDEDAVKSKLLGSSPVVTQGCRKLEQKCHAITVQVRCQSMLSIALIRGQCVLV